MVGRPDAAVATAGSDAYATFREVRHMFQLEPTGSKRVQLCATTSGRPVFDRMSCRLLHRIRASPKMSADPSARSGATTIEKENAGGVACRALAAW